MNNQIIDSLFNRSGPRQSVTLAVVTIGMVAIVGSALGFEHLGGYVPCALCLEQRNPYYLGIPFALIGLIATLFQWPNFVGRGMLLIALLCLVATAVLGIYHSGIEWQFWEGPAECSASVAAADSNAGNLLSSLSDTKPPSCSDAAGRFFGLSFAGWNVVAATALATVAWYGLFGQSNHSA